MPDEIDSEGTPASEPAEAEPEPEQPRVLPEHEALLAKLRPGIGEGIVDAVSNHGDLVVRVTNAAWHDAGEAAKARLDCEYLSFISGIDWMPRPVAPTEDPDAPSIPAQPSDMTFGAAGADGRLQVFACVQSTEARSKESGPTVQVIFKTDVDEGEPSVESWTDIYPGADWHERECWEMFGIGFEGHPHLRHLYLPHEFEGHPLRKDFPLLSREVKPWPGLVDVELMPGGDPSSEVPEMSPGEESAAAGAGAPAGGGGPSSEVPEMSPGEELE